MDLRSFRVRVRVRRRRRRVRRDFLVNALQGTILNQFPPNLACAYNVARTRNQSISVKIGFQLWPPGGENP